MLRFLPLCPLALTGACTFVTPGPPEVDVSAFNDETFRVNALPATDAEDLPTGQVSYAGQFGSNVYIDGEDGHAILGDLEMRVAFDDSTIGGTLDNVVLLSNGADNQTVDGALEIAGFETDGRLAATADGTLQIEEGTSDMTLFLNGDVLSDTFNGDAVGGELNGSGSGEVEVLLDGNGSFYGLAD